MPLIIKEFEIPLTGRTFIAVEITILAGRITGFVVRLMNIGDPDVNIARYDTAHGAPHRDVLGQRHGLLRKDWMREMTLKEALQYAINDFKQNYERYDQIFQQN